MPEVVREAPGLEPEARVVHPPERLVEVREREEDHERGEGLVAADLGVRRDVLEDRRLEERALEVAAREDLASEAHGFLDPPLHPLRVRKVDHGPHVRAWVERIAELERADAADELVAERPGNRLVHEDPLDADARLAGVAEAAD